MRLLFGPGILNLLNTALVYVTGIILMLQLSPRLTLLALAPYPILLIAVRLASRRIYRAGRAIQEQLGTMSTAIQEDLAGINVIKHYGLEPARQRAFRAVNDEYLTRSLAPGARARRADAAVRDAGRPGDADRPVGRRPRGDRRAADRRRAGRVQRLPGPDVLADVRPRLDHRHLAARHRRVGRVSASC